MSSVQSPAAATIRVASSPPRAGRVVRPLLELGLIIALCLVFFAAFFGLLQAVFPLGIALHEMVAAPEGPGAVAGGAPQPSQRLDGAGGLDANLPMVARLEALSSDVWTRRADQIAWLGSEQGQILHDRDGIQTSKRGEAVVRFDEGNALRLGKSTLVIIRQPTYDALTRTRVGKVLLASGELQADLSASALGTTRVEVTLAAGESHVTAEGPVDGDGSLRIKVDPTGQAAVAVYAGTAVLQHGDETLRFGPNEYAVVDAQGNLGTPEKLPEAPVAVSPDDGAVYVYRDRAPEVTFAWGTTPLDDRYRLTVARDPQFRQVVIDERLAQHRLSCSTLKAGTYYWRINACRGEVESPSSATRAVQVDNDSAGPALTVALPPAVVETASYALTGVTEPDARLIVGDETVPVGREGQFQHVVQLRPGVNVIVVQAIDAAGNTTYQSAIVVARNQGGREP